MPRLRFQLLLLLTLSAGGCIIRREALEGPNDLPDAEADAFEHDASLGTDAGRDANVSPNADAPFCGDGFRSPPEECDDTNLNNGDGCSATCVTEPGFDCASGVCVTECGDGVVAGGERCDDGNTDASDGCNAVCEVEPGFACMGTRSMCARTCGNRVIDAGESCDDGDLDSADGCNASCMTETGWTCGGMPSMCRRNCGNGMVDVGEGCDDGNFNNGDGCNTGCTIDAGYACSGTTPSVCGPRCGDGVIIGGEMCDDGFTRSGDGCSATCTVEPDATCIQIDGISWCSRSFVYDPPDIRIPTSGDRGLVTVMFTGSVSCTPRRVRAVTLNMQHTAAGDLLITLINGATRAVLTDRIGDARDMDGSFSFVSNADATPFPGASDPIAPGVFNTVDRAGSTTLALRDLIVTSATWTLTIDDQETRDVGTLRRAAITIYCDPSR
jgi:cysteine-rich repeat protein